MAKCNISLKNIRVFRKAKHLSQRQLSIKSGISQSEISNLENDKDKSAKLEQVEKIADALHMCPFDLMSCDCEDDDCTQCGQTDKCKDCRRRKKLLR